MAGWSTETFIPFHRWVARVATLEAIIRSIGYSVDAFLGRVAINSIQSTNAFSGMDMKIGQQ